ncbi:hypothetical protein [Pandoraea pulmonicola]|uniref:Uncharacterized protein n=1 Tax=Pandoraea pulmonicola TaxID=93221 RepID=A0AAJ4ZC21_PANPU|nr:hypothetical protein [Pandoraea pulmonicola]APD13313.1 hypothetical protein RO07_11430 [Pandoraea pulmonicola]SUA90481.1 Uncharacterised protein [Pandoraea pulmonicola]
MTTPLSPPPSQDTASAGASTAAPPTQQRVDDEPLRLVTSFNDIFVVIASWLLSFGTVWLTSGLPSWLQMLIAAAIAWGLSEIFVRQRRMTLPALWFSFSFVSTMALLGFGNASLLSHSGESMRASMSWWTLVATCVCTALGAALFWWRFRVPAVIALGLAGIVITVWAHVIALDANAGGWLLTVTVVAGLAIFLWALHWDAQDPQRTTIRSDVAFWLHLLAACMITHPIFWMLTPHHPGAVIAVFALLTVVSLVIDRRALMLSSLLYLLSAILQMLMTSAPSGGDADLPSDNSMSVAAIVVGGVLLVLSVFWQPSRNAVLRLLPTGWRARLPR